MEERLFEKLKGLREEDFYPFHMPGHKRNQKLMIELGLWEEGLSPYEVDITEIPEFDDLHEAETVLKRVEDLAAELYGAYRSFLQVNGSTGAILSAIGGATKSGDYVLMGRNCHKSVYNALELFGLKPLYLKGKMNEFSIYEEVLSTEVEQTLLEIENEGKKVKLIIITSPTYEGIVSDIFEIAKIAKKHSALLMVDEAHGAHFGCSKSGYFPKSATTLGADIVVQSLHKTLLSFTSTALLHITREDSALIARIKRKLSMIETSSPSYLLMSSIESNLTAMEDKGEELFEEYESRLKRFYKRVESLKNIVVLSKKKNMDYGKIVLSLGKGSGSFLYDYFYQECKLVMEMKSKDYVIAMTSIADTDEGFERLITALFSLDERISALAKEGKFYYTFEIEEKKEVINLPKQSYSPYETLSILEKYGSKFLPLREAVGMIAAEQVYFYPPGIPLVVAGEVINEAIIQMIEEGEKAGIRIYGGTDGHGIFVCADGEECDRKG